jgi:GNAT superfamily N-acetyltransferase
MASWRRGDRMTFDPEWQPPERGGTTLVARAPETTMPIDFALAPERARLTLDCNYLAYWCAMMGSSAGGEYGERRDVALVCCGAPLVLFNIAHLKPPISNAAAALAHAEAYFGQRNFPFSVEIRRRDAPDYFAAREVLAASGYEPIGAPVPGMALSPIADSPSRPAGFSIRPVRDAESLDRFARVASVGFGFPEEAGRMMLTPGFLDRPDVQAFLGLQGEEVVATSQLLVSGEIAGIYWVSTAANARRRGYGEAITWAAVEAGRRAGCTIASLQASEMGRPVYLRMGFEHVIDYERYSKPNPASA